MVVADRRWIEEREREMCSKKEFEGMKDFFQIVWRVTGR